MDAATTRDDARRTVTEVLLDQVTVYRAEMERDAIAIIEAELHARGVSHAAVVAHEAMRERAGLERHADGTVVRCNHCPRPAIERQWRWHRLWGWFIPVFPRYVPLCEEHVKQLPRDTHGRTLHYDYCQREDGPAA